MAGDHLVHVPKQVIDKVSRVKGPAQAFVVQIETFGTDGVCELGPLSRRREVREQFTESLLEGVVVRPHREAESERATHHGRSPAGACARRRITRVRHKPPENASREGIAGY